MDIAELLKSLSNFGELGVVIAFLIWWSARADKARQESYDRHLNERRLDDEKRLAYDRDRLAMDKELSASLQALTATQQALMTAIQSRGSR